MPESLRISTLVIVPEVAVTSTGPEGLTWSEPGAGAVHTAAGCGAAGCGATCGAGAAVSAGQWSAQSGVVDRTTPPSIARTANTAAKALRTRRVDVNCSPLWFGEGRDGSIIDRSRRGRRTTAELCEFVIVLLRG